MKYSKFRKFTSLLSISLSFIFISSCGKTEENKILPDGSLDKCTLRFSWWGGDDRHDATLKAIELWNKKYPDIKIEAEYGGWDGWTEKLNTQISGDTAPDIMQINYDWLINLSKDGLGFYDLNNLKDYIDLSGYDNEILSFGMREDKLNAITISMSGRGLFFNKDIYSEIDAEIPESWKDLIYLGNKFKEYEKYPLDLDIQSGASAWYLSVVYVQQMTGKQFITMEGELGFTSDDIKTALDFYKSLEDNHVIRSVKTRAEQDGNSALYQSPKFIDGTIAGVLEWGSAVGKYENVLKNSSLVAGHYLKSSDGNSSGWMIKPSLMYAISDDTKYPDEAGAFLDFLLNDEECAEILGTSRGIPANRNAYNALESSGKLCGISYDSSEYLGKTDPVTLSPYFELSQLKEYYNTAIEKVSYGILTTQEASEELFDNVKKYLERIR
ncbi:MAG: ABC transporter substrate-binding protein [Oscillospiraceae bacterium]|nr:ABC transporter substrate-binding protein [Oscillospiraceae bacterium]